MSNLSDKDIDRLSRDAAEFYEPDNSMLSWNKLEQNLIEQIPERPPDIRSLFRTRPFIWAPAVLLLTGITYYLIKNNTYSQFSTLKHQTAVSSDHQPVPKTETGADYSAPSETKASDAGRPPGSSAAAVDPGVTRAVTTENASEKQSVSANPAPARSMPPDLLPKEKAGAATAQRNNPPSRFVPGQVKTTAGSGRLAHGNKNGIAKPDGDGQSVLSESISLSGADKALSQQNSAAAIEHGFHWPEPVSFSHRNPVRGNDSSLNRFASAGKAAVKPGKSLQIRRPLVIGLVIGPDYSHVGSMTNDQLGNNLGISLGYYLSSRLSVNTGFQYSVKNYWTEGKFFQPQSGGVSPYYAFPRIESVNGSVNLFEIPLSLRFDFLQSEKARLFVNAGLSSYLIRKESDTYFFHSAGRSYSWDNESDAHNNYWLAIGSLSAGFEQDLGKGFSFQAEPFVRLPLRGIGAGNIKLNSYGLLFSVRYAPVLGRTRK